MSELNKELNKEFFFQKENILLKKTLALHEELQREKERANTAENKLLQHRFAMSTKLTMPQSHYSTCEDTVSTYSVRSEFANEKQYQESESHLNRMFEDNSNEPDIAYAQSQCSMQSFTDFDPSPSQYQCNNPTIPMQQCLSQSHNPTITQSHIPTTVMPNKAQSCVRFNEARAMFLNAFPVRNRKGKGKTAPKKVITITTEPLPISFGRRKMAVDKRFPNETQNVPKRQSGRGKGCSMANNNCTEPQIINNPTMAHATNDDNWFMSKPNELVEFCMQNSPDGIGCKQRVIRSVVRDKGFGVSPFNTIGVPLVLKLPMSEILRM